MAHEGHEHGGGEHALEKDAHGEHSHGEHSHGEHSHGEHSHEKHRAPGPQDQHEPSRAAKEHKSHAPTHVAAFVVTCSDSRGRAQDESGAAIRQALEGAGHSVVGSLVVTDDAEKIRAALVEAQSAGARAVVFNGGTGIGRRDCTVEAIEPLFEKHLPGFGELFRMLSYQEIGSPGMLSRATAGTHQGMIVFVLPGSPQAVRLAMQKLILPELGHLVRELTR